MSAKTTRPRVQSVSSSAVSAAPIGGAALAATVLFGLCRSLGAAARGASATRETDGALLPVSALREERKTHRQQAARVVSSAGLPPLEAAKVSALAGLAATPYIVSNADALRQPLGALERAATPAEVRAAEQELVAALESGHQRLFVQTLAAACAVASLKVGFGSIETLPGSGGVLRMIATDPAGRALVTEINADPRGEPSLETEVVGVADGSCNGILDAFDEALEEAGVRGSPPERKYTGGVCELAAARDFLRRKVRRRAEAQATPTAVTDTRGDVRRRQKLNAGRTQKRR